MDRSRDGHGALPQIDETLHATTRYLQALTVLDDDDLAAPSALPGWSRAHVVAHLSRNADAMTRVLVQAQSGEPATMYDAQDARDFDIEETVRRHDAEGLRQDAVTACARFEGAAAACDQDLLQATYTRTPDDPRPWAVATVAPRRRVEVEVHHADLLVGYLPRAWPEDFSRRLVRKRQKELAEGPSMVLTATDVDGLWKLGPGPGPGVAGRVGDLAWWLVGRGDGAGLVSSTGELPRIPRWR
jgi:maleylpyruvate isomerase